MSDALAKELAREQDVFDRAHARLEQLRAEAVVRERETLGTDSLTDSPQSLYERDVQALAAAARRSDLDLAGEGLVFGRLDLNDGTVHHIGRLGLRTEQQDPIVVDWRAPAAAAFYRATAADPQDVVRRRTITTRGTSVRGLEDELLDPEGADTLEGTSIIGDGAFLAAVSRERGPRMRDIVATIQREQDLAVRAPDDGALVVTGGPGTGKTAVALHRVAYLMYAKRDWYARRGVLVVGPSPVFIDYVGAVLPALGETSVRLSSLGTVPSLPRGLIVTADDVPAAAAVKGSVRIVGLLRRAVRQLAGSRHVPDLDLLRWGSGFVLPGADLSRRRAQVARGARSHNGGRAAYVTAVVDVAWRTWQKRPNAPREEPGDREDFGRWLRGDEVFLRWLDGVWPVLLPAQVFAALHEGGVDLIQAAGKDFDTDETWALQEAWQPGAPVTALDAAVLDELAELLGPPPEPEPDEDAFDELAELDDLARMSEVTTYADRTRRTVRNIADEADYRTYAHVVVDEAQDVAPLQWRMLARRARGATWTVVGDWVQSAWPDVDEVRRALADTLGRARVREVVLTTNYRTSTEIAELAAGLLRRIDPAAEAPQAVRSTGVEPLLRGGSLVDAVTDVLASVTGTVGVVCPRGQVARIRAELPAQERLQVLDTWQAKGLEFDGCVVVAPEQVVAEGRTEIVGLRTLYVALTRATQRLTVFSEEPLGWLRE
ncbi:MAG: ATP-dependent helicase [Frankiales bacterium]|nr:ATP-dependent helicase [Frankiales bacterium]